MFPKKVNKTNVNKIYVSEAGGNLESKATDEKGSLMGRMVTKGELKGKSVISKFTGKFKFGVGAGTKGVCPDNVGKGERSFDSVREDIQEDVDAREHEIQEDVASQEHKPSVTSDHARVAEKRGVSELWELTKGIHRITDKAGRSDLVPIDIQFGEVLGLKLIDPDTNTEVEFNPYRHDVENFNKLFANEKDFNRIQEFSLGDSEFKPIRNKAELAQKILKIQKTRLGRVLKFKWFIISCVKPLPQPH